MTDDTHTFIFRDVKVHHHKDRTVTVFNDDASLSGGATLTGEHAVTPEQEITASEYGIDPIFMNQTHDLTHSLLAAVLGLPESPSLASTARKKFLPEYWIEERAVLALQAYAAWMGVDLFKVARRVELMSWLDARRELDLSALDPGAPQKR